MPGRPLSAAQLQHNRNIAKKGGEATARKYGGYHFAHAARSARARGTYTAPAVKTPFAGLRAKQAVGTKAKTTKTQAASLLGRVGQSTRSTSAKLRVGTGAGSLPRSGFNLTATPRKRRPAVR